MKTQRSKKARLIMAVALGCTLSPTLGFGQPYSATRYATFGGGTSSDSRYSISDTIGQPDAAPDSLADGTFSEISGYWNPDIFTTSPDTASFPPGTITNGNTTVTITSPHNYYLTTNSSLTIRGTVKGMIGAQEPLMSFVQISLNGNIIGNATLGPTNSVVAESATQESVAWSISVTLVPGPNVISVQSFSEQPSSAEYVSVPVTYAYFYVLASPSPLAKSSLTLSASPPTHGIIKGEADQASLEINKVYTVEAVPTGTWLFSNWTAGTNADSMSPFASTASISFLMSSNLILQANFVSNSFPAVAGAYNGLFSPSNGVTEESSGFFTVTIPASSRGSYSAKLLVDGGSYPFSGIFDLSGNAQKTILRPGKVPLTVNLHLNLSAPDNLMTGSVNNYATNGWNSQLQADREVFNARTNPATNVAGEYTMILPPGSNAPVSEPGGCGYATLSANLAGHVLISGRLGDGTVMSQSVPVSQDGNIPLYDPLYSGQGLLLGWLTLTNNSTNDQAQTLLGTNLAWIKRASRAGTLYAGGFTNTNLTVLGSLYVPPPSGTDVLLLTNGTLTFSNGDLTAPLIYSNLSFTGDKLVTSDPGNPTNKLAVAINPANGIMTVTFHPTGARGDIVGKGVVLQNATNAAGWFLGTDQSGNFQLR